MAVAVRLVNCVGCGGVFEVERKRGRPRRYCDVCVPDARRLPTPSPAVATGLKPDPPVRTDGRCAVCLKSRVITAQARKYAGPQLDLDPFCSSKCCRRWHGTELAGAADSEAQEEGGRLVAAMHRAARGWDDVEDAA